MTKSFEANKRKSGVIPGFLLYRFPNAWHWPGQMNSATYYFLNDKLFFRAVLDSQ